MLIRQDAGIPYGKGSPLIAMDDFEKAEKNMETIRYSGLWMWMMT